MDLLQRYRAMAGVKKGGGSPIYGVEWVNDTTNTMTRTDDAVGMAYSINSSNGEVTSDFDSVFPWNEAEIVYDNSGNKFLRMPDMWFRLGTDNNGDINSVAVSKTKGAGDNWYLSKTFDYGCYMASVENDKMISQTGKEIYTNLTVTDGSREAWRTLASANSESGYIYHQTDVRCYNALMMLFWIEFATKNSNTIAPRDTYTTTGYSDSYTTPSVFKNGTRYHYIENFIGGRAVWQDGIYGGNNSTLQIPDYVTDNPLYYTETNNNMSALSWAPPQNNPIIAYGFDTNNPLLFQASKTDSSGGFSQNYNRAAANWYLRPAVLIGGVDAYGWSGLCWSVSINTPNAHNVTSRLLRQPTTNFS